MEKLTAMGLRKLLTRCVYTVPTCGGVWSALTTLERTQWLSREQLEVIQLRRLKALLDHARRTVPYYRSFDPRILEISTLEDLKRLPILSRQIIQRQFDRLQSSDALRGQLVRSSGSTGYPVSIRKSSVAVRMESASRYRAFRWVGFDFGERYGSMSPGTYKSNWEQIRAPLAGTLLDHFTIDVFNINRAKLAKFARSLESKPTVLTGNPSALLLLARFVDENGARPKVRFIISTSEQLLSEERKRLASVFNANVFDFYGSYEIGAIAAECKERVGHHVSSENLITEVLGRDGAEVSPGEIGSVVITDLNNYSMPLIRYEMGDLASLLDDECPCGRGLPLLGQIEGRITDVIVTPDGRFMCLSTFGSRVLMKTHVEQFQIQQGSRYELTVRAILDPKWREAEGEFIRRRIQSIVGEDMKVRIEFPRALDVKASGKRNLVKSSVLPQI